MMSPLALLQEGEVAEIINLSGNNHVVYRSHHCHGHGGCNYRKGHENRPCRYNPVDDFHARSRSHLQDMGLRPGNKVEMITNSGRGPLVLRIDECRIAIGRGAAMKIYVRRNTP